jgi:hypothetical protein
MQWDVAFSALVVLVEWFQSRLSECVYSRVKHNGAHQGTPFAILLMRSAARRTQRGKATNVADEEEEEEEEEEEVRRVLRPCVPCAVFSEVGISS